MANATFDELILMARKGGQRRKHEHWVKTTIPTAHAELLEEEVPISNHLKCDMVFRIHSFDPLWAEVGELLKDREVIFEHHSRSISRDNFAGCIIKQASYYARKKRRQGLLAGIRPPCLMMSSFQFPRSMFENADFKNIGIQGIYTQGGIDNLLILIVTSQLPDEAKYNFLRLLSRAPELDQLESVQDQLMEIRELTKLERERLKEAAMTLATESVSTIRQIAKRHVALEMAIEEKQALIDEVLQQKNAALDALTQKDQALTQKDQELTSARMEIEELKRLLGKG